MDRLESLGTLTLVETYPLFTHYTLHLSRPVPVYEPGSAPDCVFITDDLWAVTRYDYLRNMGSIVMDAKELIQIRFVERPIAWWIGYGRLRKKAVESVEIAVYGEEIGDFVELARVGFAYEGATRRKRRRSAQQDTRRKT